MHRFAIVVMLTIALCGCKDAPAAPKSTTIDRRPMVEVIAAPAADGPAVLTLIASAAPVQTTPATADMAGTVIGVVVSVGEQVAAGDIIARVSGSAPMPRQSATPDASARAELRAAEADLAKMEPLYAQGFVTKPRYDRAQARVQSARIRTIAPPPVAAAPAPAMAVYAPVDGVVSAVLVTNGNMVSAGQPVAMIDGGEAAVRALTMDTLALRLTVGMAARIIPAGEKSAPMAATVAAVTPQDGSTPPAFALDFTLPNGATLPAGSVAKVSIALPDGGGKQLYLPLSAAAANSPGLKSGGKDGAILIYVVGPDGGLETVRMMLTARNGTQLTVAGPIAKGTLVLANAARAPAVLGKIVRPVIMQPTPIQPKG